MPSSMAPSMVSNSECSPCSCPLVRDRPRSLAQRPLPSITMATCLGSASRGMSGGVAPEMCGVGGRGLTDSPVDRPAAASAAPAPCAIAGGRPPVRCTRGAPAARRASAICQSPTVRAVIRRQGGRRRVGRSGRAAVRADRPPGRYGERAVLPRGAADRAGVERRRPAGHGHAPQQVGVEDQAAGVLAGGQRLERAEGQLEQPQRRLPLDRGEPLGRLGDRAGRRVARIVGEELLAVQRDGLDLAHRVQRAADALGRAGQLQVDVPERLQPGAEPGAWCGVPPGPPPAAGRAGGSAG